jgi:hypothetical protein
MILVNGWQTPLSRIRSSLDPAGPLPSQFSNSKGPGETHDSSAGFGSSRF